MFCVFPQCANCCLGCHSVKFTPIHLLSRLLSCKAFGYSFPTTMIDVSLSSCNGGMLVKKLSMYPTISLSRSCLTRSLTTRCASPQSEFPPLLPLYTWNHANINNMKEPIPRFWCSFWLVVSKYIALKFFFSFPFIIRSWKYCTLAWILLSLHWLLTVTCTAYYSPHR